MIVKEPYSPRLVSIACRRRRYFDHDVGMRQRDKRKEPDEQSEIGRERRDHGAQAISCKTCLSGSYPTVVSGFTEKNELRHR